MKLIDLIVARRRCTYWRTSTIRIITDALGAGSSAPLLTRFLTALSLSFLTIEQLSTLASALISQGEWISQFTKPKPELKRVK